MHLVLFKSRAIGSAFVVFALVGCGTDSAAGSKSPATTEKKSEDCPYGWARKQASDVVQNADLTCADLSGVDLSDRPLSQVKLAGADLSGANLSDAVLTMSDLSNANLSKADLSDTDLSGTKFLGANLSGANLTRAHVSWVDFSDATFDDVALNGIEWVPEDAPTWPHGFTPPANSYTGG